MKKEKKVLFFVLCFAVLYSSLMAAGMVSPEEAQKSAIGFLKYILGALSGIATVIAGINFLRGYIEKTNGDQQGEIRIQNSIKLILAASFGWILFALVIGAGMKFNTAVEGLDAGWK
jgi:hypothetical protein